MQLSATSHSVHLQNNFLVHISTAVPISQKKIRFIENDLETENETFRIEINDSLLISVAASKVREDFHTLFKVKTKKQSPLDGVGAKRHTTYNTV